MLTKLPFGYILSPAVARAVVKETALEITLDWVIVMRILLAPVALTMDP